MADFAADGTVVHSTDLNKILKLYGVGSPVAGSGAPASGASSAFLINAGTTVVTTGTTGGFTFTYPVAFSNGVLTVVADVGDNSVSNDMTLIFGQSSQSKTTCAGVVTSAGTGVNTGAVRINYIAIGW